MRERGGKRPGVAGPDAHPGRVGPGAALARASRSPRSALLVGLSLGRFGAALSRSPARVFLPRSFPLPFLGRLKRVAEEGEGAAPQPLAGKRGRAAGEPGALAGVASESAAAGAVGAPGVPLGSSGHAGSVAVGGGSASGPGLSSAGVPARAGAAASGRAGVARPGARAAAGPAIPPPQTASYTRLSLLSRTVKDLRAVCQAWGLAVSGNKNELAHRILAQQRQAGGR